MRSRTMMQTRMRHRGYQCVGGISDASRRRYWCAELLCCHLHRNKAEVCRSFSN